jgi:2-amino-4-hydroxy-6-hydroxymethyldihydropteridine diphosphokinase
MCGGRARTRETEEENLVYLGLGSNLGDRRLQISHAVSFLEKNGVSIVRRSSLYETEPVDFEQQPLFMNAVVGVKTDLPALELLYLCKEAEHRGERKRTFRFGPRTIDIDVLLYKGIVFRSAQLLIPHPRMHERRFVLVPLVEIAPGISSPGEGTLYADILAGLDERKKVTKLKGKEY